MFTPIGRNYNGSRKATCMASGQLCVHLLGLSEQSMVSGALSFSGKELDSSQKTKARPFVRTERLEVNKLQ